MITYVIKTQFVSKKLIKNKKSINYAKNFDKLSFLKNKLEKRLHLAIEFKKRLNRTKQFYNKMPENKMPIGNVNKKSWFKRFKSIKIVSSTFARTKCRLRGVSTRRSKQCNISLTTHMAQIRI